MSGLLAAAAGAFWIGILTSISPCPLASNIAAISYISKEITDNKRMLLNAFLYALGRTLSYVLLAVLLVKGFLSVAATANWLQEYMNILLGPLLIIVGMFLLELLNLNLPRFGAGIDIAETAKKKGSAGTVLLGAMFALSFCPVSAALYFGTLLPLAVKNESWLFLPFVYGIGTALPVVFFGTAVATGAGYLGKAYNSVAQMELWVRRAIGVVFVCVGVWYSWTYILQA